MIIDPDFLEHWRMRLLVDLLDGDEMAPIYMIRILSHCQNRRTTQLKPMTNPAMKALCRYAGDADKIVNALIESEFIERSGDDGFSVNKFAQHNAQLINSWANGAKGGRPKKKPSKNPTRTLQEPTPNPREPEKRREEKRRRKDIRPSGDAVPEELNSLIDAWNTIPTVTHVRKRDAKNILNGWKKVQESAEVGESFEDVNTLMARIRGSTGIHKKNWFKFDWLFRQGQLGEWNVIKVLEGRYEDNGSGFNSKPSSRVDDDTSRDSLRLLE